MSAATTNAWSIKPKASQGGESLEDIMTSQLIQALTSNETSDVPVRGHSMTEEEFFKEAGLAPDGSVYENDASVDQNNVVIDSPFDDSVEDVDTVDADYAYALHLQEVENEKERKKEEFLIHRRALDSQKGHVKVINRDFYEDNDEMVANAGEQYRLDLECLEAADSIHSKEVAKATQKYYQKQHKKGIMSTGKATVPSRATSEGVLDARTRMLLFKHMQNGLIRRMHGVIKTGKEASVYVAEKGESFDSNVKQRQRYPEKSKLGMKGDDDFENADGFDMVDADADDDEMDNEQVCVDECECSNEDIQVNQLKKSLMHISPYSPDPLATDNSHVIVKIFRTTLNEFSRRKDYIYGDYRYDYLLKKTGDDTAGRTGSASSMNMTDVLNMEMGTDANAKDISTTTSPMSSVGYNRISKKDIIRLWCIKEYRNLKRCYSYGLRVPYPYMYSQHVLYMSMIPKSVRDNSMPALQLREYLSTEMLTSNRINVADIRQLYLEIVCALYMLFQYVHLVHGDINAYNILISDGHPYLIDFGQTVDRTHPKSSEYLLRDVTNISEYFDKIVGHGTLVGSDNASLCDLSPMEVVSVIIRPLTELKAESDYEVVLADGEGEDEYEWVSTSDNVDKSDEIVATSSQKQYVSAGMQREIECVLGKYLF